MYLSWSGADELDKQLTIKENHGCASRHKTLLQNELIIINQLIYRNVVMRENSRNVVVAVVEPVITVELWWW